MTEAMAGEIRVVNYTLHPIDIHRNEHFCHIQNTQTVFFFETINNLKVVLLSISPVVFLNDQIVVDPNNQSPNQQKEKFKTLHSEFSTVFENKIGQ